LRSRAGKSAHRTIVSRTAGFWSRRRINPLVGQEHLVLFRSCRLPVLAGVEPGTISMRDVARQCQASNDLNLLREL